MSKLAQKSLSEFLESINIIHYFVLSSIVTKTKQPLNWNRGFFCDIMYLWPTDESKVDTATALPWNESKSCSYWQEIQDFSCSSWQDLGNLVRLGKKSKIYLVRLAMIVENLAKFGISWQDILPRSCQEIAKSKKNLAKTNMIPSTEYGAFLVYFWRLTVQPPKRKTHKVRSLLRRSSFNSPLTELFLPFLFWVSSFQFHQHIQQFSLFHDIQNGVQVGPGSGQRQPGHLAANPGRGADRQERSGLRPRRPKNRHLRFFRKGTDLLGQKGTIFRVINYPHYFTYLHFFLFDTATLLEPNI